MIVLLAVACLPAPESSDSSVVADKTEMPLPEMTDVWDTGAGELQIDLTFHRGAFGTGEVVRPFSIATVPYGEYVATANVTVSHDDTGFGSRD